MSANALQGRAWNGPVGPYWSVHQVRCDAMPAALNDPLLRAAPEGCPRPYAREDGARTRSGAWLVTAVRPWHPCLRTASAPRRAAV
ncbi:hypothetical protein [Streptomyces sp. CC219B]|uniref:hypothetical protein n=1 Tax=Streptomyces sp. CC219B TaxID=3044574 RepID=UPI0024A8AD50|nr:hypothetical protein [Streptomyces sp. CC219B]